MGLAMRLTHENRRKLGATVIAAVLMALGPVLMTQSKVDGEYPYSVPVCNLLAEIMKLCISATFLAVSHGLCREPSAEPPAPQHGHTCPWPRSGSARTQRSRRPPSRLGRAAPWIARVARLPKRGCGGAPVPPENRRFHRVRPSQAPLLHSRAHVEFARFMIPAFIYFANNNIVFFILRLVDPVTFQLLSQLKTIFTGLLFRLFLQRRLSAIQYTALITLACGTATAQIPSDDSNHESALGGLLLSVVSAFLSGAVWSTEVGERVFAPRTHMGKVHKMVDQVCGVYFQQMRRYVYVTPKSYLSFIQAY